MDGIFRNLVAVAQRTLAGGQLDLRSKRLLGAGGEHYGAVSAHAQFKAAEKARVVVKEAGVRRAWRHDVSGKRGGEKCLAVNQGKIVDFARLGILVCSPGLRVRRWNFCEFVMWNN